MRPAEGLTAYATFMTPVASIVKTQESLVFSLNGGREGTRTWDLLRVHQAQSGASFHGMTFGKPSIMNL